MTEQNKSMKINRKKLKQKLCLKIKLDKKV